MRDLIIVGDGTVPPADAPFYYDLLDTATGNVTLVRLSQHFAALDNNPTRLNKQNLLSSDTQELLGLPPDTDSYIATPDLALRKLSTDLRTFALAITQLAGNVNALVTRLDEVEDDVAQNTEAVKSARGESEFQKLITGRFAY